MRFVRYPVAKFGLGTESVIEGQPLGFAPKFENRFLNIWGHAEKRNGITGYMAVTTAFATSAYPLNGIHEWVNPRNGSSVIMADGAGRIFLYNDGAFTSASGQGFSLATVALSGKDTSAKMVSFQMNDKLCFVNGSDRNFYTNDGGATWKELKAIIQRGKTLSAPTTASGSDVRTYIDDSNVTNWRTETLVGVNDMVFFGELSAYAVITSVGTTTLDTTLVGSGTLPTGLGKTITDVTAAQNYEIIDLVELNIVPTGVDLDNVALATSGTNVSAIAVSGLNFAQTEIRIDDIIYNATRNAVTKVLAIVTANTTASSRLQVVDVTSQASGDSLVFLKSAMPIASYAHVHEGRAYYIDSRDQTKVRVSGPNDPEDMTTFTKTLSSNTMDYGAKQPKGDILLSLSTFQRYLVAGGSQAVYVSEGIDPIQDTSALTTDFEPIGLYPQGLVSKYGLQSTGDDMLYVAHDGLRSFKSVYDARTTETKNVSEPIKSEVTDLIRTYVSAPDNIKLVHFKNKNWVMLKLGDYVYNYNYTPIYQDGKVIPGGTWSKYTGKFASMNGYFVAKDGTLYCCDDTGKVYSYNNDTFDDAGDTIPTSYSSSWLTMQEGESDTDVMVKDGRYIKPFFETGSDIVYTITVEGGYDNISSDSVTVTAAGGFVIGKSLIGQATIGNTAVLNQKLPLRWRAEECRINITTDDTKGPDIIKDFTLYGNVFGRK